MSKNPGTPPGGRRGRPGTPAEQRAEAMRTLEEFNTFLRHHGWSRGRVGLSASRAHGYLSDPNVRELMGDEDLSKVRRACELLR